MPQSVAIIGASHEEGKIGYIILNNIIKSGFRGTIYPINPKGGKILGRPVCTSFADIEGNVDLAIIVVPAKTAVQEIMNCAKKGVKFAVIITSGFSEIGNIDSENEMVEIAHQNNMRILGPNVFGLYSAPASLNATFGPSEIRPGNIAVISQSGALGIAMIGKTAEKNMGLSTIISIGNKADITETELVAHLFEDDITKVIFLYIEGLENGQDFMEIMRQKPCDIQVVAIKAGKSEVGARAVASHTGSLAGSDKIFDAAFKQIGVLRAKTIEEGFDWVSTLAACPEPKGKNVVIITNGGGIGVLAADACEKYGVNLMSDIDILKKTFEDVIPSFGSFRNPVDLTGQAGGREYRKALENALKEKEIHAVIALYCQAGVPSLLHLKETIMDIQEKYGRKKPIIYSIFGGKETGTLLNALTCNGIPAFDDVENAVSALNALYTAYKPAEHHEKECVTFDTKTITSILRKVAEEGRSQLLGTEAKVVMEAAGLNVPPFRTANDIGAAVTKAQEIGYPVAMKVISEDIVHKTDGGGVILDLENEKEVIEGYEAIMRNCQKQSPDANIRGIEITKMVSKGLETIIGATTDISFGKVLMFGLGGIYVEVLKDVAFRVVPVAKSEVDKMIHEINSFPILMGVRGENRKDINAVIEAIFNIGILVEQFPEITELDINPLVVYEKGAKVLDARITIEVER